MRQLHYLYTTNGFFPEANGILLFKFIFIHTIIDLTFRLIFKAASLYAYRFMTTTFFFKDCKNVHFNDVRGFSDYYLFRISFTFSITSFDSQIARTTLSTIESSRTTVVCIIFICKRYFKNCEQSCQLLYYSKQLNFKMTLQRKITDLILIY